MLNKNDSISSERMKNIVSKINFYTKKSYSIYVKEHIINVYVTEKLSNFQIDKMVEELLEKAIKEGKTIYEASSDSYSIKNLDIDMIKKTIQTISEMNEIVPFTITFSTKEC